MTRYLIVALDRDLPNADAYDFGDDHGEMGVSAGDACAHVSGIVAVEADSDLEYRLDLIVTELRERQAAA